ncbi:hypothetical protein Tco_1392773 [Tanacetum coccineum]
MIMISKMRDKINPRKKRLNLEEEKGQKVEKSFGPDFVSFMVGNEPTSYREAEGCQSGCTTALNGLYWETDGESVLRDGVYHVLVPCPFTVSYLWS